MYSIFFNIYIFNTYELLSADRAKQIKTVATINEDPTEILIRELRAENDKLKKMLERGTMNVPIKPGMTDDGE